MADNLTVTNQKTTFDANTNADLPVRTTEITGGKHIQHVRLDLGSGTSESVVSAAVPVSGTVTVNAGTNLNTSALALESGGNLDTIAGKDFATQTTLAALNAKVTAVNTGAVVVSSSALPSGAATAALQLPNSHDVTIDNAAGAAAVNIQDGGNSITVDGTVAAAQSGTWNIGTTTTVTTVATVTNITNQGQLVDNAGFTDGTTRLNMAGFIFDEVAGTALTENDGAAARIDSKRAQVFTLEDATTRGRRAAISAAGALSVDAGIVAFSTIGTGSVNVTTAGTRVALAGSTACKRVVITAKAANTGVIWVGGSTVAANSGIPLVAYQQFEIDIANLATVNIDSTVNGEGVTFVYYN